ncbi:MAG: hypothetical protein EOO07_22180 [Chitinophagaceae bacterium]|nr:MAG: hypothetical protein EOO07_22180 [Chitinophagaceae bacterium]
MKVPLILFLLFLSNFCFSAEFDNSIGFGLQYAGIFGWQGSLSENNIHGRLAIGVVGVSVGLDADVNDNFSVGGTIGSIGLASHRSINFNYYPGGVYTQGWRIGADIGTAVSELKDDDGKGNFVSISFGYSFR